MPARSLLIERFVAEQLIMPHIRIEGYLMVALGVKPLSLLTLPGELPGGEQFGYRIDNLYRERIQELEKMSWNQRIRWQLRHLGQRPIRWKRQLVREAYQQIVENSAAYQAHMSWAKAFGLQVFKWEVRPTVREIYLFRSPSVEDELHQLMAERMRIKEEVHRRATRSTPLSLLVYPEEQSPDYLARLGRLLGYPPCCIERYRQDRAAGINVETRAADELKGTTFTGEERPWAYFTRDFVPCSPVCEQASGLGQHAYRELYAIDRKLGDEYSRLLEENCDLVRHYPETISRQVNQVQERGHAFYRGV